MANPRYLGMSDERPDQAPDEITSLYAIVTPATQLNLFALFVLADEKQSSSQSTMPNTYRLIDTFAGCGGMTHGFLYTITESGKRKAPFSVVWANDHDPASVESYQANFDPDRKHTSLGAIEQILANPEFDIPESDVVIGGPPCQGFSLLNRNRHGDSRRELWWYFSQVAKRSQAKVVVMENVQELLASPEFDDILEEFAKLGFTHGMAHVLLAANYGVPQTRKRTIIMLSRIGPISLPRPTHLIPNLLLSLNGSATRFDLSPWQTVRDAISDLPPPSGTDVRQDPAPLNLHFGRNPVPSSIERYKAVPEGGNRFDLQRVRPDLTPACWIKKTSGGTDLFGRLWWNRPSVTIRTEFFKPEKGRYLHPIQHRPITHREGARLQGFPDSFIFCGSKTDIAKQIGNAVPPPLASAIREEVTRTLAGKTTDHYCQQTAEFFKFVLGETIRWSSE